ncbi:hypothetical protein B0H16DRAFT_1887177 [Mycena metata]|uniref:F-box domain-containing protein n=1 Tax=Mycena metata TaxID=1033252 RepID=A0AAD7IZG5_9AGAR|nr:hypothetical protein B0H16DRAFT_1887177 [Mycena metata]
MALSKSILYHVPTELLREIVSSVDAAKTMAVLSRTSRLFNAITTPILYRHIFLGSVESTLECFDTLAKTPKRHDYIRSLRIAINASDPGALRAYVPTDMIFPLEAGLRPLRHLQHLYLRIPDFSDEYLVIFATLVLPELRIFSTYHTGTFSPLLSSFLNHHPNLTHLELFRPFTTKGDPAAAHSLPLTHLPNLRVFRGCAAYAARLVVFHRGLGRADILDAQEETDLDVLLAALALATTATTPFVLTFLCDGPQTALFAPLVKWLPQVRMLSVGPFMGPPRGLAAEAIQEIGDAMEQLTNLASFDFDNVVRPPGKPNNSDRDEAEADLAALTAWGERCSTLVTSRIHTRNWARHSGAWVQLDADGLDGPL